MSRTSLPARLAAVLAVVLAVTLAPPTAAVAGSATHGGEPVGDGGSVSATIAVVCPIGFPNSDFGPLGLCTQTMSVQGQLVTRRGWYSPITGVFNAENWMPARNSSTYRINVADVDGNRGTFCGRTRAATAWGDVIYGHFYLESARGSAGMWGNYSFVTGRFHPQHRGYFNGVVGKPSGEVCSLRTI